MSEISRYLAMVLGIGLVIFVHEFGHFLAARLCRVRVDVFSLGFGPRLFAWRRGATLYQLALLPLGGYVRMAGEEHEPGRAPAPYELQSKSVGQRFFIYAGGVLMNVIFAMVVFPIVLAVGVPMHEPLVGSTIPGGPAWRAGVQPGSRVLAVNGHSVLGFDHIGPEVALGPSDSTALRLVPPGASEPVTLELEPVYSKGLGMYEIGIRPATDHQGAMDVEEDSPAWRAGMRNGDRIVAIEGAPAELPLDEQLALAGRGAGQLAFTYVHEGSAPVSARIEPLLGTGKGAGVLGVYAVVDRVADLRENEFVRALGLRLEDRILSANGVELLAEYDLLLGLRAGGAATQLEVERAGARIELEGPHLDPQQALALYRDIALVQDGSSARVTVMPHGAASEAGMRDGDRIVSVDGHPVAHFDELAPLIKQAGGSHALEIVVRRRVGESDKEFTLPVQPRARPTADYGFMNRLAMYTYEAPSPGVALATGVQSSLRLIGDSWLTLKRILTGQVSGDNIGGIITIGYVSYSWAGQGLPKLFYFLCMLSVSLAFLNVLPIPVLDGGHLFFLVIEKIKGSPVSERVLSYSQIVGLVLIVSLVVYVTFNDIQRWIL